MYGRDMAKQFNIRSEKAHALALDLSNRLGRPMHQIVEEALAAFDAAQPREVSEDELWGPMLERAQAAVREANCDFRIEDLYDPETGLPA